MGAGSFERAALAQLVEHRIRNAGVVGSSPTGGTIFFQTLTQSSAIDRGPVWCD